MSFQTIQSSKSVYRSQEVKNASPIDKLEQNIKDLSLNSQARGQAKSEALSLKNERKVTDKNIADCENDLKVLQLRNDNLQTHVESLKAQEKAKDDQIALNNSKLETLEAQKRANLNKKAEIKDQRAGIKDQIAGIDDQKAANDKKRQQLLAMLEAKKKQAALKQQPVVVAK